MKGFGTSILAFIFLIAIAVTAFYTYGLAIGVNEGVVKKISIEKDVYLLGNAAEYGKLYLDSALKYSVYQSLYDYNLEQKNAGFGDPTETESGIPYVNGSTLSYTTLYSLDEFKSVLSKKIKENLNKYTENSISYFNSGYKISLPKYEVVIETPILIKAKPNSKIEVNQKLVDENIVIRKSADLMFAPNYTLFEEASVFVSSRKPDNSVNSVFNSFKIIEKKNTCQAEPIEVFNSAHNSNFTGFGEAEDVISSMVFSGIKDVVSGINSTNKWSVSPSGNVTITVKCVDSCAEPKSTSCAFEYVYDFVFNYSIESDEKFLVVSGQISKKTSFESLPLEFSQKITNIGI